MSEIKKQAGFNFLHRHPSLERTLNVPQHVVVDLSDWEQVIKYFQEHPEAVNELGKTSTKLMKYI